MQYQNLIYAAIYKNDHRNPYIFFFANAAFVGKQLPSEKVILCNKKSNF